MHVLYISPAYHPLIGGAETHVRVLAEGIAALGHTVTVITDCRDITLPCIDELNNVKILRTLHYREWRDQPDRVPWEESIFGLLREFQELFGNQKPDIIHAHCQVSAILGSMMRDSKCKLVVTMHETQPSLEPFGDERSKTIYTYLPYDLLIACSKFFYEQAIYYGANPSRTRLIYYCVDLDRFTPRSSNRVRYQLGFQDKQLIILLVGRLKARKGIMEFVNAMKDVIREIPEARGIIMGSINSASLEYASTVKNEIKKLGLENSVIVDDRGWGLDEMPEAYASADLVVQPSYAEGLGISILEAMAMMKPVIGTSVSGIKEIIVHDQNGLLVPPQNSFELANAIIDLLRNQRKASDLATKGYAFVTTTFSKQRMIDQTLSAYKEILNSVAKE